MDNARQLSTLMSDAYTHLVEQGMKPDDAIDALDPKPLEDKITDQLRRSEASESEIQIILGDPQFQTTLSEAQALKEIARGSVTVF